MYSSLTFCLISQSDFDCRLFESQSYDCGSVNRLTNSAKIDTIRGGFVDEGNCRMKPSERIKPVSYLASHAAEIIGSLPEMGEPFVITQNGEAKAVLLDYDNYERTQETLVLLKILALDNKQIEEGNVVSADQAIRQLRQRRETA